MPKGKSIYITKREAEALSDAIDMVRNIVDGASKEFNKSFRFDRILRFERRLVKSNIFI